MILSKRERYIALATLLVFGVLGLDRLVLTPVRGRRQAMLEQRQQVVAQLERARALFDERHRVTEEWEAMLAAGLAQSSTEVESRLLHAVRDWAEQSGLTLTSVRPERAREVGGLQELTFHTSGEGGMSAVAGFLWRLETSPFPVRPAELQVAARKEGEDELSVQVRISALCQPSAAEQSGTPQGREAGPPRQEARVHE